MPEANSVVALQHPAAASASTPRTRPLATFGLRELEKIIQEPDWHNRDQPDFHERFVVSSYRLAGAAAFENPSHTEPISPTSSSMAAVSIHTRGSFFESSAFSSRDSDAYTPSLDSRSTVQSGSSISTSFAESVLERYGLELDDNGVNVAPLPNITAGRLLCLFKFMDCAFRSNDFEQWDTHCKAHLRGCLPTKVQCPVNACQWTSSGTMGEDAWRRRTEHILVEHAEEEFEVACRADEALVSHMWRNKIIELAEYQELRKTGMLMNGRAFISSAGMNRDRRRERRGRPGGRG